jgi:hypothetical protein
MGFNSAFKGLMPNPLPDKFVSQFSLTFTTYFSKPETFLKLGTCQRRLHLDVKINYSFSQPQTLKIDLSGSSRGPFPPWSTEQNKLTVKVQS